MNDAATSDHFTGAEPQKPSLSFSSITFSGGQVLEFEEDDIVVFVGPNNAGKSALLREMEQFVARPNKQQILASANLRKTGDSSTLRQYLEKNSLKTGGDVNIVYNGMGYSIHHSQIGYFDNHLDRSSIASFFCSRVSTEGRITGSNPAGALAFFQQPPSHPIHLLLMDDVLADRISSLFNRAFGVDLIPFRGGGSTFPLLVGVDPELQKDETELSRSFIDRLLKSSLLLAEQGDGMRSFASVLLHVLVADNHSVQLLDEPEAFLHPPQARLLGEFIARERRSRSQLFIATHSTDILDGLISAGDSQVRIVRIRRDGDVNPIKELSRVKTQSIVKDTLARFSGVLDGLFYQHVIICESDADCLFYNSLLHRTSITGKRRADVLFIHASGKHRMAQLAATLRELDVPVSIIADIDVLSEEAVLKNIYEELGGSWLDIHPHFEAVKKSVDARRPQLNAQQVAEMIRDELSDVVAIDEFPKRKKSNIKRILSSLSPWDHIKQVGRAAFSSGQAIKHYDQLVAKCSSVGFWIVPVGELEGFCRSIEGRHGPAFVANVLEERDLDTDPELKDAREFIS